MSPATRWGARLAISLATFSLAVRAHAQEPPADPPPPISPPVVPGDHEPLPEPPAQPSPDEPPAPEPRGDPDAPRREELLDESDGRRQGGPQPEADDVCGPCFVIGGAVAILIAAIPLAAEADGAGRTKDALRAWLKFQEQPVEDLGFIPGYGFARQSQRQERFTIAAAVTGGIGGAALIAGVIWLAADGRIPGIGEGPRRIRVGAGVSVEPIVSGDTIGAVLSF